MNENFNEYKDLFLEEANEYLMVFNESLVKIEKDRKNQDLIDTIFRVAHTLKSSSAAVGLTDLSHLFHKSEDLMQLVRTGERIISPKMADVFFSMMDMVQAYLLDIKNDKTPAHDNISKMIKKIEEIIQNKEENITEEKIKPAESIKEVKIELNKEEKKKKRQEEREGKKVYKLEIHIDEREQLKWLRADLLISNIKKLGNIIKIIPEKEKIVTYEFNGIFFVIISAEIDKDSIIPKIKVDLVKDIKIEEMEKEPEDGKEEEPEDVREITKEIEQEMVSGEPEEEKKECKAEEELTEPGKKYNLSAISDTIRVPVKKLDALMNLVGELVVTNSGIKLLEKRILTEYKNVRLYDEMNSITGKLMHVTSDLQYNIMNTRMVPIGNVFHQFNRVVRDLTNQTDKEIELVLKGEDTELDKKVIDIIGDALMHLIRNSIDHGIETKTERRKEGKNEKGEIMLSAMQMGDHIVISVQDDGHGIDKEKIKAHAVKRGVLKRNEAEQLSEKELLHLIFEAGFSTAEKISEVSGRGVGLDVVEKIVKELSGTVDVRTEPGKGTEFIINLPLTLAITTAILVESNSGLYAFPIMDIIETLKVGNEIIKNVDNRRVINLRDEVLPLVSLKEIFDNEKIEQTNGKKLSVIVIGYAGHKAGIIIDKILGEQEIVVKPLESHYKNIKGLSGAAILGDGSITLVVDILGIVNLVKENEKQVFDALAREEGNRFETEETDDNEPDSRTLTGIFDFRGNDNIPIGNDNEPENDKAIEDDNAVPEYKDSAEVDDLFHRSFEESAVSLSKLINKEMTISYAKVEQMSGEGFINKVEESLEEAYFGSIIKITGTVESQVVLLISRKEGLGLYDMLFDRKPGTTKKITNEVTDGIGEINNILSSAFTNRIANMMKVELNPSIPNNCYDMLGAILQGIVLQPETADKKIYYAETTIKEKTKKKGFHARLLILSDRNKLSELFNKRNVL